MAQGKQALKGRIRSVSATRKITSAMELIANAKLQKQRVQMEKNREYADTLRQIVSQILANNPESECVYLKKNQSPRTLTFMFTSDKGLCIHRQPAADGRRSSGSAGSDDRDRNQRHKHAAAEGI